MADASEGRDFDESRLYLADPITVTLIRPTSPQTGAQTAAVVRNVQEQPVTLEEVDSMTGRGSLDNQRTKFRVWRIECGGLVPRKDYLVVKPDGTTWRAQKVETLCHGRQFEVDCILTVGSGP